MSWFYVQWLFRSPFPRIFTSASRLIIHLLPLSILALLFRSWPVDQLFILRSLLRSPSAIFHSLMIANEEMCVIHDIDTMLLHELHDQLWFYYAETDAWIGEQCQAVVQELAKHSERRVVQGHKDITNTF